ncbi:MAG TPA: T9SS type A sorting domain-containing protein [Hanamia sp.]
MRNLLPQHCTLQPSLLKTFFKTGSFKHFYFRHFTMVLLFWFGGDAGCDFMSMDKNTSTAAATFRPALVSIKDDGSFMPFLTSSTDYFRSRQNGFWSAPTTWESSSDNINWQIATEVPTKDANTIRIQTGHTVSITNSVSLDQTMVQGILELQTGGILNINDGEGDDITISANGVLQIASNNTYANSIKQNGNSNIHIATNGKILIGNGAGVGTGYESFATSLVNVWDDRSVYEYNSSSTFVTAGLTYFPNVASTEIPIFRVSKVGGTAANGSGNNFYVNGLFEINTNVSFSGAGGRYFRNGIRGTATLSQTGAGKFYLTALGAILDGASLKIVLSAVFDLSPLSTIVPIGANVTITGANINNTPTNPPNSHGDLTINGTLDVTDRNITNTNSAVVINGTYRTAHSGGFSGSSSSIPATTGTINLNTGSTIELYALGDQLLRARADFKNLIFSGSGTKTPGGPFNPAGTITIKDAAIFDCTGNINGINIGDDNTNLTMTGNSRLILSTFGPNPKMGGVYNLTGGAIEFRGSNLTPQTIRNQTYQNIEVTSSNVNNSDGNIILNNSGSFTVKSGGVFTINDNTIAGPAGTQTVIVESGGTFKCGNTRGFHGFAFTTVPKFNSSINADIENIILQPNSTVEYSRSQPPLSSGDQPITTANGLIYQNLILSGTGNKTAPPNDLRIQGNLSKTGSCNFIHNNGTVIFNGSDAQTYLSSSPQMVFYSLTNENNTELFVNNNLSVYKKLLLGNNSKLNVNADITLLSDKNQTANVAPIPVNSFINYGSGRFIVERYINTNTTDGGHSKSWQLIATPAFGETIHDTWQEKGNTTISGYGTWITDPSGTSNGFDAVSFSPSLKYYNPSSNDWLGISNTNINLENEKGYMIFVRGDRKANNLSSPATPTILRTRGKLYSSLSGYNPPASIVDAGKFQSIGNPYASTIDFTKINTSPEIENSFIVWDPTLGGDYGLGGYQTITAATNFKAIPGGSSIYNTSDDYRNIQSGQAFFVYNYSAVPGLVTFSEACKTESGNHLVNRDPPELLNEKQFLFTSLYATNGKIVDGNAMAYSNQFSNKIDKDDALKLNNSGENIGIKRDGKILAVEARQSLQGADTIFFHLSNLTKQKYQLMFVAQNMLNGFEAFLYDQYLKKETAVSLSDTTFADFLVTDDATSAMTDRFMIVFRQLSVSFVSINAFQKNENVFVEWKVENENNLKHYVIEHSVDGIHFSEKAIIEGDSNCKGEYSFGDLNTVGGINYYRICGLGNDGKITYSTIVKVFIGSTIPQLSVYPNPLQGDHINLQFLHQPAGTYQLRLLNSSGQLIMKKEMNHQNGNNTETIQLNNSMAHGVYQLEIIKPDGQKNVIKVRK